MNSDRYEDIDQTLSIVEPTPTLDTGLADIEEPSQRSPQMAALLEMDDETVTGEPSENFFSTSRIIRGAQIAITIASINPWVKAGLIGLLAVVEYVADGSDFHSFMDEVI